MIGEFEVVPIIEHHLYFVGSRALGELSNEEIGQLVDGALSSEVTVVSSLLGVFTATESGPVSVRVEFVESNEGCDLAELLVAESGRISIQTTGGGEVVGSAMSLVPGTRYRVKVTKVSEPGTRDLAFVPVVQEWHHITFIHSPSPYAIAD